MAVEGVTLSGEESEAYLLRYYLGKRVEKPQPKAPPAKLAEYVPVSYKVTKQETNYYALQVLNKVPGEDGITGKILVAA